MKVGIDGIISGLGTVRDISMRGLLVESDLVQAHGSRLYQHMGKHILVHGAEPWNRFFFIMGRILRINLDGKIACSIDSCSSEKFLQEWIEKK